MTARVSLGGRARRVLVAVGWIAALIGVGAGLSFLPIRFAPHRGSAWGLAWQVVSLALAYGVATGLVAHRFARLSWEALGWPAPRRIPARLAAGTVLGIAMAAVAVGLALVLGGAALAPRAGWVAARALILPLVVAFGAAALFEELVFRGAPLRLLAQAIGPWPATLLLALAFGFAHLRNPAATVFSTVNIALAAVLLSVAFFSRGGMPLAWGLHFGWNAGLALVFAAPVSGVPFAASPLTYAAGPRLWVDGGPFGPEGGVVATLAMAGGVAALLGRRLPRPREWLGV